MPQKIMIYNATINQLLTVIEVSHSRKDMLQPRISHANIYNALRMVSISHKRLRIREYSLACFCFSGSRVVIKFPMVLFELQNRVYFTISAASNAITSSDFITSP